MIISDRKEIEDEKKEEEKKGISKKLLIIIIVASIVVVLAILIVVLVLVLKKKKKNKNKYDNMCSPDQTEKECWAQSYKEAKNFISKCNLTEKVNLLFGTENMKQITNIVRDERQKQYLCVGQIDPFRNKNGIDFKGMCLQDGPAGIRFAKGTSISWQASLNTAATFNKDLMYQIGKAQGEEAKQRGINVLLCPCMNMLRNPQGGRVWEGFGEDPYLAGIAGTYVTRGIQSAGVIASIKHYVGNEQESYRKASSSNMKMETLMDVYVEPFYRAIKDGHAGCLMASYNAINDTYVYESKKLLIDIARNILDFQGFVVSDWWEVVSDTPETINSGLDMNMPGGYTDGPYGDPPDLYKNYGRNHSYWSNLEEFVKEGKVTEDRITEAATRIIASMYQLKQMNNYPSVDMYVESKTNQRIALQRQAATESQVLLKNDGILPISSQIKKIAVIGSAAFPRDCVYEGDLNCINSTNNVYRGHIPLGYGSGTTNFAYLIDPYQAISALAKKKGIEVTSSGALLPSADDKYIEDVETAKKIASEADIAIVYVSANSGEEYIQLEGTIGDRPDLKVWHNGEALVEAVVEANPNTIVVVNAPATVDLPFLDDVSAVIFSGFAGAESGNGIADVLFGEVNPSGHLPFVWAKLEDYGAPKITLEDYSVVDASTGATFKDSYRYNGVDSAGLKNDNPLHKKEQYNYTEEIYIGQRWFNKNNIKPTFPFGFGLSYTTFLYSELKLSMNKEGLSATFYIKNIGQMDGMATAMMFLTFPEEVVGEYPEYILKGFEKVKIKVGEKKKVTVLADDHALSYFNVKENNYVRVNQGIIKVYIGENGDPSRAKLMGEIQASF